MASHSIEKEILVRIVRFSACASLIASLVWACGGDDTESSQDGGSIDASSTDAATDVALAVDSSPPADAGPDARDAAYTPPPVVCGSLAPAHCAVQIAVGYHFACAVMADGSVQCWGDDSSGQLGNAALDGGVVVPSMEPPVIVAGVHDVRALAAASASVCVLESDGSVWCWGENNHGESAQPDGSTPVFAPTQVTLPANAIALVPGYFETCAELADHSVYCWGWNKFGQLAVVDADGAVPANIATPTRVPALEGAVAIGFASNAYYAVEPDGGMIGFGINNDGQLGRGVSDTTLSFSPTPAPVVGLTSFAIGCGAAMRGQNQCAVLGDRTVECWGRNDVEQLALGPDAGTGEVLAPTLVAGLGDVFDITSGDSHLCAQTIDGGVWCWGSNNVGQCASAALGTIDTPTQVGGLGTIVQVRASDAQFSCALEIDGNVDCWGSAAVGETGQTDAAPPVYQPSRVSL